MKIDTSKQGYKVLYKNKKFKTNKGLEQWLNKIGKYIISFVDKGQDCLEWVIDVRGEVIHANLQAGVWNGRIVDLARLKVGKEVGVFDFARQSTKFYTFKVRSITDAEHL